MRLVAHRGFAGVAPENTLLAVERAARVADGVEVDVRRCGSGELVVVHDETVDRVTGGTGRVADLDLGTLQSLSVGGSGEPIPTLAAVVAAVPPDVELLVELKEPGLAAETLALCATADVTVLVQSFDEAALAEAREAAPSVPRSLLFAEEPEAGLAAARELDCAAVGVHHERCTASFVRAAHDAGLSVYAWTVTDRESAARLAAAGVDAVISDVPDVLPGS